MLKFPSQKCIQLVFERKKLSNSSSLNQDKLLSGILDPVTF